MRRLMAILLTLSLLAFSAPPAIAFAADDPQVSDIRVQIGDSFLDAVVLTLAGRTLVPFRAVGDALGATVGWEQPTQTASLTLGDRTVQLQIGSQSASVQQGDQSRQVTLDAPPILYQSRTYVPARFVAEGLGYEVKFDSAARVVLITAPAAPAAGQNAGAPSGDMTWLRYDLTRDSRIDNADVREMMAAGATKTPLDVNADGKKDTRDVFALMLKITELDRTADLVVDAQDFGPPAPVALPKADADATAALARALLTEAEKLVPRDLESKLRLEWSGANLADSALMGSLWEQAGITSLAVKNLEVAQWAFAKAAVVAPQRDTALANLGFTLAESGRHTEAMQLYARAREINPRACATNSNIGWVFARHGQLQDAVRYYREAVSQCPQFAQYHLNLGAALLRTGNLTEAQREFAEAARQNPHDKEALMMAVATKPAEPKPMDEYRREYERQQQEYVNEGLIEEIEPWENLSASDKWEQIRSQIAEQMYKELQEQLKALADRTSQQLHSIAEAALPKGVNACDDLKRWAANWEQTVKAMIQAINIANMEASQLATASAKREAADELAMGNQLLEMVLTEAQADMVRAGGGDAARKAFEETVHYDYELPMQRAAERLRTAHEEEELDIPDAQELMEAVILSGLMLPVAGALTPGYGESLEKCGINPQESQGWQYKEQDGSFALSLGIVQLEWKPDSGELKLQVGQGVMVAGTWSPASGFGFQAGYGVDFKEGAFQAGASHWVKFGSDGSISQEIEGGGSIGGELLGANWQHSAELQLRAATHEPIGAIY